MKGILHVALIACVLVACGKHDEPSPVGQAVTQGIRQPIDKAHEVEREQLQAAEDARKKIDAATQ